MARARTLERAGQWSGAIDAYLAITTQDTADLDFLEGVRDHVPHGVTQSGLTRVIPMILFTHASLAECLMVFV